jgi:prepilin-type processing-associated H-X9-DG protein
LPAIQAAREAARRNQCQNNLKQLSLAHLNFESSRGGFVYMAKFWTNAEFRAAYPTGSTIGSWYDDHSWYIAILPYIEEGHIKDAGNPDLPLSNSANQKVRQTFVPLMACPTDIGQQRDEWEDLNWARIRSNYVVNAGNTVYGQHNLGTCNVANPVFPDCRMFNGAPFVPRKPNRLAKITDGTSNTLMMSEILVLPTTVGWGGPYSDGETALGGQVFTGYQTPNSSSPDALTRQSEWWYNAQNGWLEQQLPVASNGMPAPPPQAPSIRQAPPDASIDSNGHKQQWITARSKHPGGVNASRCDGSVDFFSDGVDLRVWDELCSAASGAPVPN